MTHQSGRYGGDRQNNECVKVTFSPTMEPTEEPDPTEFPTERPTPEPTPGRMPDLTPVPTVEPVSKYIFIALLSSMGELGRMLWNGEKARRFSRPINNWTRLRKRLIWLLIALPGDCVLFCNCLPLLDSAMQGGSCISECSRYTYTTST